MSEHSMDYQTYQPHPDLESLVKCYWTLEVPAERAGQRQRIVPDGCIEMIFILGDDIRRYAPEGGFIIQPRQMVLGQITEPFFIEPTGYVNSFAARFYPYGFANFMSVPIDNLANKETPIELLFSEEAAKELGQNINRAADTQARIAIVEQFLLERMHDEASIDSIVKTTIDAMLLAGGDISIKTILGGDLSKRRQLERKFLKHIGMSPKQLGKVIRLQAALKMMRAQQSEGLTKIAYKSNYYDQAHFAKDFKEFTGTTPGEFFKDGTMTLSSLFYT
jgi:AraC-like DNA-binding protein